MSSSRDTIQYVYHRKSPNFIGTWIVPLNSMQTNANFKGIYENEKLKYNGREWQREIKLPVFNNCLWNDVIFLCPIHPHTIYQEYEKLGLPTQQFTTISTWFKIPASQLNPEKTTTWSFPGFSEDPNEAAKFFTNESFQPFNLSTYAELNELPPETLSFYREETEKKPKERPKFTFFKIPHVMTTEPIDVSNNVSVIHWKDPRA